MAKRDWKNTKPEADAAEEVKVEKTLPEQIESVFEEVVAPATNPVVVVSNCSRLNIRKKPNLNANVVCVVNAGTELTVAQPFKNGDEWMRVSTKDGVEGHCMRKYVTFK